MRKRNIISILLATTILLFASGCTRAVNSRHSTESIDFDNLDSLNNLDKFINMYVLVIPWMI